MRFLFDNNTSLNIVRGLRDFGLDVCHVRDVLPADAEDAQIVERAAELGCVLITCDRKTRTRPPERMALRQHNVTVIYLPPNYLPDGFFKQVEWLMRHWSAMEKAVQSVRPGTGLRAQQNGTFRIMPD